MTRWIRHRSQYRMRFSIDRCKVKHRWHLCHTLKWNYKNDLSSVLNCLNLLWIKQIFSYSFFVLFLKFIYFDQFNCHEILSTRIHCKNPINLNSNNRSNKQFSDAIGIEIFEPLNVKCCPAVCRWHQNCARIIISSHSVCISMCAFHTCTMEWQQQQWSSSLSIAHYT